MIRTIVKYGDPVLETPAEPVTEFNDELRQLVDDMFETMYAAQGVGLAAPQIGILKQLIVIDTTFKEDPEGKIVLINPTITHADGRQTGEEGCLSFPGLKEKVTRPARVTVRHQELDGEWYESSGEELLARAFCHEIDHLHGDVFINHVSALKRDLLKRKIRKLIKQGEW
jgi:peptide deformylase